MTHTQTDVFFYEDGRFEEGYKPGTIRIRMDNGMGGVNVHIMADDPREQLRQLRDLCQSQIEALDAHYVAMASMPADPPPPEIGHCGCPIDGPHGTGCPTMLGDIARADIEKVAAPTMSPAYISKALNYVENIDSESADLIVDIASGRVLKDRTGETGRILHGPDCMCSACDTPF